jgi:hypothetical protein
MAEERAPFSMPEPISKLFSEFLNISAGAFHLSVVGPLNIPALDPSVIWAIESWLRHADRNRAGQRPLCLCCNTEFSGTRAKGVLPAGFAVAEPFAAQRSAMVLSGICDACFHSDDLRENVLRAWRRVLPDLQVMTGGRA